VCARSLLLSRQLLASASTHARTHLAQVSSKHVSECCRHLSRSSSRPSLPHVHLLLVSFLFQIVGLSFELVRKALVSHTHSLFVGLSTLELFLSILGIHVVDLGGVRYVIVSTCHVEFKAFFLADAIVLEMLHSFVCVFGPGVEVKYQVSL